MIKCNLAVVLAEKGLKISKVSQDTGISRTTLTALAQNTCKGFQLDTLNTLCKYLDVKPAELILFNSFDFKNVQISDFAFRTANVKEFNNSLFNAVLTVDVEDGVSITTCRFILYGALSYFCFRDSDADYDSWVVEVTPKHSNSNVLMEKMKNSAHVFLQGLEHEIGCQLHEIAHQAHEFETSFRWSFNTSESIAFDELSKM